MALTCGFYNSVGGDRKYSAEDFNKLIGCLLTDGVFQNYGECFAVSPYSGLSVTVGSGRAWFNDTWTMNDSDYAISIDSAHPTMDRIDTIVLSVDKSSSGRVNDISLYKGVPDNTPVINVPENTDDTKYYILAEITVRAAATEITGGDIYQNVGHDSCPYVTGILSTVSVDYLFGQWEGEFDEWLEHLKHELDEDQVGHLQAQIDELDNNVTDCVAALPKLGDLLFTVSPSVSDDYDLANGRIAAKNEDIYPILPESASRQIYSNSTIRGIYPSLFSVVGNKAFAVYRTFTTGTKYSYICTIDLTTGDYRMTTNFATASTTGTVIPMTAQAVYVDGKYTIYHGWYYTSVSENGNSWTTTEDTNTIYGFSSSFLKNGNWYVCGTLRNGSTTSVGIFKVTSTKGFEQVVSITPVNSNNATSSIFTAYCNGYIFIHDTTNTSNQKLYVYRDDLTNVSVTQFSQESAYYTYFTSNMKYFDGKYYCCNDRAYNNNSYGLFACLGSNPSSPNVSVSSIYYEDSNFPKITISSYGDFYVKDFCVIDNTVYAFYTSSSYCRWALMKRRVDSDEWTNAYVSGSECFIDDTTNTYGQLCMLPISTDTKNIIYSTLLMTYSSSYYLDVPSWITLSRSLPTVSLSGAYCYVKVRSGTAYPNGDEVSY